MSMKTGIDDGPPLPARAIAAWRDDEIAEMRKQKHSLRFIAEKFNMSHEGVRDILKRKGIFK